MKGPKKKKENLIRSMMMEGKKEYKIGKKEINDIKREILNIDMIDMLALPQIKSF